MKPNSPGLPIHDVAARFGVATHVLRHWEDMGLLCPQRDSLGNRTYTRSDLERVAVIMTNKLAGMNLRQIRALLDADTPGRRELLAGHLASLDQRERELARSRAMTRHALECHAHDIATCPNFRSMIADVESGGRWQETGERP